MWKFLFYLFEHSWDSFDSCSCFQYWIWFHHMKTCAGAVMLTDIVFWCLLVPFMSDEHFSVTLVRIVFFPLFFWKMNYLAKLALLLLKYLSMIIFPAHVLGSVITHFSKTASCFSAHLKRSRSPHVGETCSDCLLAFQVVYMIYLFFPEVLTRIQNLLVVTWVSYDALHFSLEMTKNLPLIKWRL